MRMNGDPFLWKLSRVHRTVPPLSTPAPGQSPASLGIHPSSTRVQWGGWVTRRIRVLQPQSTRGPTQARESDVTCLGRGLGNACCVKAQGAPWNLIACR